MEQVQRQTVQSGQDAYETIEEEEEAFKDIVLDPVEEMADHSIEDHFPDYHAEYSEPQNDFATEHVMAYLTQASQFENSTSEPLHNRVRQWESKITAHLQQEEQTRPPFDVGTAAHDLIALLDARPAAFQEVAKGKEAYHVARLFLASLHLANEGKVQIERDTGVGMKIALN